MAVDHIRYDMLAQEALRGVVRRVLADAAKKGLPGEHHFFITFATRDPGVRLSARMREQYPEEMTIVLQHQYWDLKIADAHFEVGLSFGGVPETLSIPFDAIKSFFDPSVQFGLQFETVAEDGAQQATVPKIEKRDDKPATKPRAPAQQKPAQAGSPAAAPATKLAPEPSNTPDKPGGQVVELDRFRKK